MLTKSRKSFSKTFIVWNDYINLVGALIPSHEGRASVCGTIRFKNGEKLSFSSKSADSKILHQKLMSLCQSIAKFYGTKVIYRKDRVADSVNETFGVLEMDPSLLN
ncbi:MAG: hypothetical protein V2J65_33635 [Desulfobacteraceae bacterium]|jgi:hypothetical protein|nr:hypothetical protein [Desulfobacteraceae bacterium]